MERTRGSLRSRASSCARSATSSQFTTSRRKTSIAHSTSSRSQRSCARTTNSVRQWPSITWPATTGELERCAPLSTSSRGPWPSRAGCSDPRPRQIHIWIFALFCLSSTSTNWHSITPWVQSYCSRKWCSGRNWTRNRALKTTWTSQAQPRRRTPTRTRSQFWQLPTTIWASSRSSSGVTRPLYFRTRKQLILQRKI